MKFYSFLQRHDVKVACGPLLTYLRENLVASMTSDKAKELKYKYSKIYMKNISNLKNFELKCTVFLVKICQIVGINFIICQLTIALLMLF